MGQLYDKLISDIRYQVKPSGIMANVCRTLPARKCTWTDHHGAAVDFAEQRLLSHNQKMDNSSWRLNALSENRY